MDTPGASLTQGEGLTVKRPPTQVLHQGWLCRSAARRPRACLQLLVPPAGPWGLGLLEVYETWL